MRQPPSSMKVLYGVREGARTTFMSNPQTHEQIIKDIIWYARRFSFDGIFLDFDSEHLTSFYFERFMEVVMNGTRATTTPRGISLIFRLDKFNATRLIPQCHCIEWYMLLIDACKFFEN